MHGWIKLHRQILDWEWWDEPDTFRVFLWLLLSANYEDKMWRGILVKRGQILTSLKKISESTGISQKKVRIILGKLEGKETANKSTNKYRLITIINYEKYQQLDDDGADKGQAGGQTKGRQRATTKEIKKEKNKEDILGDVPPPPKPKAKKATRIPEGWYLEQELGEWAEGKGLTMAEIKLEAEKFKNYWSAASGQKATKLDWDATWRTWILNKLSRG